MQGNILLIDDEQDFLDLTKRFMEKINDNLFNIKTINSSIEAMNLLKSSDELFDVIVSDYQMPELNGLELFKKIRNDLKISIPFILMTGHGREEVAMNAINLGIDYYIQKSLNIELQYKELNHFVMNCIENNKIRLALEYSKNKFNLFFKSATESMFLFDSELNLVEYNGKNASVLFQNLKVEDLIGKNLLDFAPYLKNSLRLKQYKEVIKTGNPLFIQHANLSVRGSTIHGIISAFKVGEGMGVIMTDITGIFETETELRRNKATLENYLEATTENVVIFDQDLNVVVMNKNNQEFWFPNQSIEDLIGKNVMEISPYVKNTERIQLYKDVLETGESLVLNNTMISLEEKTFFVNVKVFRIIAGTEKFLGMIFTDVTAIREAEKKLKGQKELIENFIKEFSHDANNIINVLKGNADLFNHKVDTGPVSQIIKGLSNLSDLLHGSVELVKSGLVILEKENVDLNHIVQSIADLIIPKEVKFSIVQKLPTIKCDPLKVSQLFQNLFINAITHGKAKNIIIEYDETTSTISISNDGTRFPQSKIKEVFEKQIPNEFGHGIGLIIVKRIVDAHGWKISLDTEEHTKLIIKIYNS